MFLSSYITLILTVLSVSVILLMGEGVLKIAVLAAIMAVLYEIYHAFSFTGKKVLLALGFVPVIFVFAKNSAVLPCMITVYVICLAAAAVIFHGEIEIRDIAFIFFIGVTVTAAMWHIVLIRTSFESGKYLVWMVFSGAWFSDLGAFVVGKTMGTHKIIPKISPEKTLEGFLGGFLGSVAGIWAFGFIMSKIFGFHIHIYGLWILGIVTGITAQLGDLVASCMKRECGIKDFSHFLPGFGGVLDRLDSVILTVPVIYYFITYYAVIY